MSDMHLKFRRIDKRIDEDTVPLKQLYHREHTGTAVLRRVHLDEAKSPEPLRGKRLKRTNSTSFKKKHS